MFSRHCNLFLIYILVGFFVLFASVHFSFLCICPLGKNETAMYTIYRFMLSLYYFFLLIEIVALTFLCRPHAPFYCWIDLHIKQTIQLESNGRKENDEISKVFSRSFSFLLPITQGYNEQVCRTIILNTFFFFLLGKANKYTFVPIVYQTTRAWKCSLLKRNKRIPHV